MSEAWQILLAGRVLFSRGVQGRLAYANYFLLDLVGFFLSFGLTLMLWIYVDAHKTGGLSVGKGPLIAYLALALVVNFSQSLWLDNILASRIRSGLVATDLLKPMNFQWMYFFYALADVAIQGCMGLAVLIAALLYLPDKPLKLEALQLSLFACSFALAVLVQYGICFLFTLGAFFTHFGYGIFYTRLMLHMAFSGIFAPLAMYPESLRTVAQWLPFHCVVHTPVTIGLGWAAPAAVPGLLLEQALWAIGLLALGQFGFRVIVGRLSIQGG